MKTLAKALIGAAAFLELAGDDIVDPDNAIKALEDIAFNLRSATPEELAAIREALKELIADERAGFARTDTLRFYENFMEDSGLDDLEITP